MKKIKLIELRENNSNNNINNNKHNFPKGELCFSLTSMTYTLTITVAHSLCPNVHLYFYETGLFFILNII